ncbi:MAG: sulfotransferase [Sphingobium sp.]
MAQTHSSIDDDLRHVWKALKHNDFMAARALTDGLFSRLPSDWLRLDQLGQVLFAQDRYVDAARIYGMALNCRPDDPRLLYNRASVLRLLGQFEEAEKLCDKALRNNPLDWQAQWLRSSLRRQCRDNHHVDELVRARSETRDAAARSWLGYALAKELEDIEDYDAAFAAMAAAGQDRRSTIQYDISHDEEILSAIQNAFDDALFAGAASSCAENGPVFIIGLPRTGTTLCERILSCDGLLAPAGELPDFALQLVRLAQQQAPGRHTPRDLVKVSRSVDFAELGKRYRAMVRTRLGQGDRFIDKLPLNFLYAGLIRLAMPDARIVHMVRDPIETCLAIYKHPFEALYPFSYDLTELARYYRAYVKLMEHWQAMLTPLGVMMEVRYEDLTRHPEETARRLREFCGLPWNPVSIDLARHDLPVSSASAVQVRQPINTASIRKSDRYGIHLDKLRRLLR